jgi:hypothetical protein
MKNADPLDSGRCEPVADALESALGRAAHYLSLADREMAYASANSAGDLEALSSMPAVLILHDCLMHSWAVQDGLGCILRERHRAAKNRFRTGTTS